MTPTVFLYVLLFTALVAGAAAAAEWGVQGRMPARHFWSVAIVLALGAPPAIVAVRARWGGAAATSGVTTVSGADLTVYVANGARQTARATGNGDRLRALVRRVRSFERLVMSHATSPVIRRIRFAAMVLWPVASLALLGWIVAGVLHWRRERRTWEPATVDGIAVELSPSTGPAVLGLLTQRIVLPSWATAMEPRYRTLMLAHECEHIRARDPQRLALALGALVLMPWNAALWWAVARLRRAIELDCDARVLRTHPAPKAYGYLLLEVAARGRNTGALAMPLVGLLRLPSELETRLRAMTRPRTIARRTLVCAGVLAVGALGTAFTAPVPRAMAFGPAPVTAGSPGARSASERIIVRVRSAGLTTNPATYAVASRAANGRVASLTLDTIPRRTLDSIAKLNHALDSVRTRLRKLEADRAPTRSGITIVDSAFGRAHESRRYTVTLKSDTTGPTTSAGDAPPWPGAADAFMASSAKQIDAAISRYYPDLAASNSTHARIWFVADTAGHVLKTERDDASALNVSSIIVHRRYPAFDVADIGWVSIRRVMVGNSAANVFWVQTKH